MLKAILAVVIFAFFSSQALATEGFPTAVMVPKLDSAQGPITFVWTTRGSYSTSNAPGDWEKGRVFLFQAVNPGFTTTITQWEGDGRFSTSHLKKETIACLQVQALQVRKVTGSVAEEVVMLWEYRWGEPTREYRRWEKERFFVKPSYC